MNESDDNTYLEIDNLRRQLIGEEAIQPEVLLRLESAVRARASMSPLGLMPRAVIACAACAVCGDSVLRQGPPAYFILGMAAAAICYAWFFDPSTTYPENSQQH